jgi:dCTP deaminase
MAILSDRWIREQAQANGMIEPFVEAQRRARELTVYPQLC